MMRDVTLLMLFVLACWSNDVESAPSDNNGTRSIRHAQNSGLIDEHDSNRVPGDADRSLLHDDIDDASIRLLLQRTQQRRQIQRQAEVIETLRRLQLNVSAEVEHLVRRNVNFSEQVVRNWQSDAVMANTNNSDSMLVKLLTLLGEQRGSVGHAVAFVNENRSQELELQLQSIINQLGDVQRDESQILQQIVELSARVQRQNNSFEELKQDNVVIKQDSDVMKRQLQTLLDAINTCVSSPCQHGGHCVNGINGYSCRCQPGYNGLNCQNNIDECASSPCHDSARCIDGVNSYSCNCSVGYNGDHCQTNINECASWPCQNGGSCIDGINRYQCNCLAGDNCQTNINECASSPCLNGGTCFDGINSLHCRCAAGFNGLNCENNINECGSSPCQNGGSCVDGINRYQCNCLAGYSGYNCQTNINECASSPCLNGGTCYDGINSLHCRCSAGFNGLNCENNVNECASSPCQNGGTCVDGINRYSCNCLVGYNGVNCQNNVNECASSPCQNGGTCVDGINSYSCNCLVGYNGVNCQNNVNECASSPCQNGGTCVDGINIYSCNCPAGYNGVNCQNTLSRDCADVKAGGITSSGVYTVYVGETESSLHAVSVYCDMTTDGGGWTVFQRRQDGSENFYRNWTDYANGFGNIAREFWLGNDNLFALTRTKRYKLRVDLADFNGNTRYAEYSNFTVGSSTDKYRLVSLGTYSGNAGDSLTPHVGRQFSARDQDNDVNSSLNCAVSCKGAWWYNNCHYSNLNGFYYGGPMSTNSDGVNWYHWTGWQYSLRFTEMKIMPNNV